MKIAWLPRYSEHAASSRLRVYTIHREIERLPGITSVIGYAPDADVLVVQKAIDNQTLDVAARFRGRVVYDFDDEIPAAVIRRAASFAALLTTDSETRRALVLPDAGRTPLEVLHDPIDYCPEAPLPPPASDAVAWFGNYPNVHPALWMLDTLARRGAELLLISDLKESPLPAARATLVPWCLATFAADLRRAGMCVLAHGNGVDQAKSSNKMAAAITLGLPCIVYNSPSYTTLAVAADVDWCAVDGERQLVDAWRSLLDRRGRGDYLAAAQPYVWEHYHPRVIAGRFLWLLARYCEGCLSGNLQSAIYNLQSTHASRCP